MSRQNSTREKFSNMKAELERSKRMCQKEKEERSEALRAAQAKAMQAVRHRKAEVISTPIKRASY